MEESGQPKIWTTESDMKTHITPPSTTRIPINNHVKNSYLVGIQSKFRRKYYHKSIFILLILIIISLIIAIIVISCVLVRPKNVCNSKECLKSSATFLQNMDFTANPCEDFFQFSCGNFENEHPRPDTQSSYDWFTEKQYKIYRDIRNKLQNDEIVPDEPFPVKQVKLLYKSCNDIDVIEKQGFKPLFKYLNEYNLPKIPTMLSQPEVKDIKFDWIKSIVKIKRSIGVDKLIGFDVFPDPKNRSVKFLAIGSPSQENDLPLVDDIMSKRWKKAKHRWKIMESETGDSIEETEDEAELTVLAYSLYMKEIISVLMKNEDPKFNIQSREQEIADAIKVTLEFSKEIYKFIEMAENVSKIDDKNLMDDIVYIKASEIQNITDSFIAPKTMPRVFEKYFTLLFEGLPHAQIHLDDEQLLSSTGDLLYLKLAMKLIADTPLIHIEMFLWWTVVEDLLMYTTNSMRQLYYDYSKMITGIETSQSRSSYCTSATNKLMGMAVSYLIIDDKDFPKTTKPRVEMMLSHIRTAFNNLVRHTTWMDWETRQKTSEKSQNMKSLIGFPDWILNKTALEDYYSGIKINKSAFMDNVINLLKWQFMDDLSNWRMPSVFEWATAPSNVNAFHTFQSNTISIPIAILQFPFYHLGLEALNYGSIGTILGHELTHGFDDVGRQFDKEGNKIQWWTNQTITEYVNRAECFIKQYNKYQLTEIGEHIDGEKTLGENIADNGGLREAFYAYNYYVKSFGEEPKLPGFEHYSHEQLFFMAFGNVWCETLTTAAMKFALEDSHCPGRIRLLGSLSNSKEFLNAFKCNPEQKMYKKESERCIIW